MKPEWAGFWFGGLLGFIAGMGSLALALLMGALLSRTEEAARRMDEALERKQDEVDDLREKVRQQGRHLRVM